MNATRTEKQFYQSNIHGTTCGHRHKTFNAAEDCARRRLKAGEGDSVNRENPEICVRKYHSNGTLVGG